MIKKTRPKDKKDIEQMIEIVRMIKRDGNKHKLKKQTILNGLKVDPDLVDTVYEIAEEMDNTTFNLAEVADHYKISIPDLCLISKEMKRLPKERTIYFKKVNNQMKDSMKREKEQYTRQRRIIEDIPNISRKAFIRTALLTAVGLTAIITGKIIKDKVTEPKQEQAIEINAIDSIVQDDTTEISPVIKKADITDTVKTEYKPEPKIDPWKKYMETKDIKYVKDYKNELDGRQVYAHYKKMLNVRRFIEASRLEGAYGGIKLSNKDLNKVLMKHKYDSRIYDALKHENLSRKRIRRLKIPEKYRDIIYEGWGKAKAR